MTMHLATVLTNCRAIVQWHHPINQSELLQAIDHWLASLVPPAPEPPASFTVTVLTIDAAWHHTQDNLAMVLLVAARRRAVICRWVDPGRARPERYSVATYAEDGTPIREWDAPSVTYATTTVEQALGLPSIRVSPVDLAGDGGIPA